MHLLFEKSYPKDLVEALRSIHILDARNHYTLSFFDKQVDESLLEKPVVFLFDYEKKGIQVTTSKLFELGYGVIALKTNREEKLDLFSLALTLIGLWPKIIEATEEGNYPFVLTYRYKGHKLTTIAGKR